MTLYDSSDLGVGTVMGTDDTGAAPLVGRGTALVTWTLWKSRQINIKFSEPAVNCGDMTHVGAELPSCRAEDDDWWNILIPRIDRHQPGQPSPAQPSPALSRCEGNRGCRKLRFKVQ